MVKKFAVVFVVSIALSVMLLVTFSDVMVDAQDDSISPNEVVATATVGPDGPPVTMPPEEATAMFEEANEWAIIRATEIAKTSIFDFRVAYLIAEDMHARDTVETDYLVQPDSIAAYTGALTFHNWDDFIAAVEQAPFQVILVHGSMADAVDTSWLGEAYRNQAVVGGISMDPNRIAEMVGDHCRSKQPALLEYFDNLWMILTFDIELENPEYRELAIQSLLNDCTEESLEGLGRVIWEQGYIRNPVMDDSNLDFLQDSMHHLLLDYGVTKPIEILPLPAVEPTSEIPTL